MRTAREYLFVALDQMEPDEAVTLARKLRDSVGGYKVGMELTYRGGPDVARRIAELGRPVFLDLKLHDIPQTVAQAVRAVRGVGCRYVTLHLSGGEAMARAAQDAAEGELTVLGVTVLTSLDAQALAQVGFGGTPAEVAERLLGVGIAAGIDGYITSGQECRMLRARVPGAAIGVPGVRRAQDAAGDQRRVVTPAQAVADGADLVIVGRPITRAADPVLAAEDFVREIEGGMN